MPYPYRTTARRSRTHRTSSLTDCSSRSLGRAPRVNTRNRVSPARLKRRPVCRDCAVVSRTTVHVFPSQRKSRDVGGSAIAPFLTLPRAEVHRHVRASQTPSYRILWIRTRTRRKPTNHCVGLATDPAHTRLRPQMMQDTSRLSRCTSPTVCRFPRTLMMPSVLRGRFKSIVNCT